jgi:hypothetical protein
MSEALVAADPSLRLVRGHYYCSSWGPQPHWWCEDKDGNVIDPTKDQFPSQGRGFYEEFDGTLECDECGKEITEAEATFISDGKYAMCSNACACRFVGIL